MRKLYNVNGKNEELPKMSFEAYKDKAKIKWGEIIYNVGDGNHMMIVDEEGRLNGAQFNESASNFACRRILGNAIVCPTKDIK